MGKLEGTVADADGRRLVVVVLGADLFFCRECSSSMVFAFTGGALSSWQIPFSGFSLPNMMSVAASFYKAILAVTTGISVPFNNLAIIYKQQLQDIKLYTFYMELDLQKPYPTRGSDLLTWEVGVPL
ncbi:hypothetical protein ZIOFF_020994 [Zingiber officinale]|uniref:Uncharacterized protein n=1 Tax=Zingiber officinale TaxID=94328 RepID=A0A8J5H372_ZINOF|nr:hypothetical protein ZIOFF_020994 [Zingiber officinale]